MTEQKNFIHRPADVQEFGKICPQCERILLPEEQEQNACNDCYGTIGNIPELQQHETTIEGESHD